MECPNPECRRVLEAGLNQMVSKNSLWKFLSIFGVLIILGAVGIFTMATGNKERVRVLEVQAMNVDRTMTDIKVLIKDNIIESKEARLAIHKRITDVLGRGP
uniref:Uncharacterized protein n=1 Tax=viral metagenome TaxID=1070528 RepID=A0A6M3IGL2_9ZZZZ